MSPFGQRRSDIRVVDSRALVALKNRLTPEQAIEKQAAFVAASAARSNTATAASVSGMNAAPSKAPGAAYLGQKAARATSSICYNVAADVAAYKVADLASVCKINLGKCRALGSLWNGEILTTLPPGYQATTSHSDYLAWALPEWWNQLDDADSDIWGLAAGPIQWGLDWDAVQLQEPGLYWTSGKGFLYYAIRYAVATMYAFAGQLNKPDVFGNACLLSKEKVQADIRNAGKGGWTLTVAHKCQFQDDRIQVASDGAIDAFRTWYGGYKGLTLVLPTDLNDSILVTCALADYFFSWGLKLYDYVCAGESTDPVRDLWYSVMCARSGLSEIVDLVGLLVHEHSHSTGFPATEWECVFVDYQECCHFELGWSSRHRLMARLGLPLSRLPDMADRQLNNAAEKPTATTKGGTRDWFDFDNNEEWSYKFSFNLANYDCDGSWMTGTHTDLWEEKHKLWLAWLYPSGCAAGSHHGGVEVFNE